MPFNKTNKFSTEDVMINIPSGALYDTIYFSFRKTEGTPVMLSGLYSIHNLFTPVQKPYTLAIKPTTIPAGKESKMLIVGLFENMSRKPISSTWSDGFLKAEVTSFGDYFIGIDTIAPIISAGSLSQGINLTGRKEIKIKITDDFSGIKNYVPVIDGNWAMFEYDPKNEAIVYKFDETRIPRGSKHHFSLKVSDNLNNVRTYNCDFIW
jgi:hypothetical protein